MNPRDFKSKPASIVVKPSEADEWSDLVKSKWRESIKKSNEYLDYVGFPRIKFEKVEKVETEKD